VNRGEFTCAPAVTLEPGDLVLLLTDGILEAQSPEGRPFGLPPVLDVVRAHRGHTPTAICQALLAAVQDFCRPRAPHDDATVAVIRLLPDAWPGPAPSPGCGKGVSGSPVA
jgi:serine phosphatase RsbU (regulator of sigma subunit)